jgi:membrane protease YdiL (CAAX protease family)
VPDETDPDQHNAPPVTAGDGDPAGAAGGRSPGPWGRAERKRLIVWLAIGFIAPLPVMLALGIPIASRDNVFTIQRELRFQGIGAVLVLLATWIVSRWERRPLADYGAPPRQAFGRRFLEGLVWGFAALSAVLFTLHLLGDFQVDFRTPGGPALIEYGLGWGVVFMAVALHEEFGFRGYLLFTFSKRLGFWRAALLLSLLFAGAHIPNPGETPLGILHVLMIGVIWCLTIRRTGTLWFAVGYHAAWDWAETFFYGTPDSGLLGVGRFLTTSVHGPGWLTGGPAGPEGSVITVGVLLIVALLVHLRFPAPIYPDRPT